MVLRAHKLTLQHKKPTLFQRLTKSGFIRAQEQLSANDMLAKAMMRKRACELRMDCRSD